MTPRILDKIRGVISESAYHMTAHAVEEMAEDDLDLADVEMAILTGQVAKTERDDPRGTRYTIVGRAVDGEIPVGVVGRFKEGGQYLIITVYRVTES